MANKVLYQSTVHGSKQRTYRNTINDTKGEDGVSTVPAIAKKRIQGKSKPFRSSSGAGIGGERRRRKIDEIVDR